VPTGRAHHKDLLTNLVTAIEGDHNYRTQLMTERWRVEWAYERDRLIERWGVSGALDLDESIRGRFSWLRNEESVPSPNIVRSTVDSIMAFTVTQTPPIGVFADGAKFEDQYAVEEFEAALNALFNTPESAVGQRKTGLDATLGGHGYAWPAFRNGEVVVEQLQPWQVHVDPNDARHGRPRSVHVEEYRDREEILYLLDEWQGIADVAEKKRRIKDMERVVRTPSVDATSNMTLYDLELSAVNTYPDSDQLRMVHSWRVATAPGRDDGRYVCTVFDQSGPDAGIVLWCRAFSRTTLPVQWFEPLPSATGGIHGTGYGHLILSWQEALDRSMYKMQRALDLYGHIRILVPKGTISGQMKTAMATKGIVFIEVDGAVPSGVPKVYDPQVVRKEDVENVERILELSSSTYGINQMMSRGASQLGANASGQALQEEYYRTLDRFTGLLLNWQAFRIRMGGELLNQLDDVLTHVPDYAARYTYLGRSRRQKWSDLQRLRERCDIRLELRGDGALSRGGRVARTQEWASQGLIDESWAQQSLLETPDATAAARAALAPIHLVEWQLRTVIEQEDWREAQPGADTPLDLAVARATQTIQRAIVEGANPLTIARLREYKGQAERQLADLRAGAMASAGPDGGGIPLVGGGIPPAPV
jgi:hypothetical protein